MVDLTTNYLGLKLANPFCASSSPLTNKLETALKLEEAGVAAIVMPSLFEEQVIHEALRLDRDYMRGSESYAEALSYLPEVGQYSIGPEKYLENLAKIKKNVGIPVLGSLNGVSTGGWVDYARRIEEAGADALELNLYEVSTDPEMNGQELEDRHVALVEAVRAKVSIPLAVKLSPFYTALPNFACRLTEAGANGLVLFNRFYQPDIDLEMLEVVPHLVLSNSHELRLPLRWIAILYGQVKASLALTTGIHTPEDLLKAVMAGADVTNVCSVLLQEGVDKIGDLLRGVTTWMEEHEYKSISEMKGSLSLRSVAEPAAFERANYMKVLKSYR